MAEPEVNSGLLRCKSSVLFFLLNVPFSFIHQVLLAVNSEASQHSNLPLLNSSMDLMQNWVISHLNFKTWPWLVSILTTVDSHTPLGSSLKANQLYHCLLKHFTDTHCMKNQVSSLNVLTLKVFFFLYKKDLRDPDNHDGMITHLEPDILECEVKWALGSITTNKANE